MSYKEIIDNVSNIEDLDNTTILKVLEKFSKTIEDFAIEQSGLNNLVNVEFIPSDNNTTYTGDSVDYLGTLKLTLSDNIIVNKSCNIKFNIKGSNTIVVDVDEFNNSLELHLDNSVVTTLAFAESERQKSETDGALVHEKEIADVEHIETIYDMSSTDSNINQGNTAGVQFGGESKITVSNKYNYYLIYTKFINVTLVCKVLKNGRGSTTGNVPALFDDAIAFCNFINNSSTSITPSSANYYRVTNNTVSSLNNSNNAIVTKVEGVY